MNILPALTHRWRLSTKVVVALAIAMLPMGILALMLAIRSHAAIGNAMPTTAQLLGMALPIMMWLAALLTGWFAVHRLIVEPLAAVQQLITAFGACSDPARTRLRLGAAAHGSAEIATLAASFNSMADAMDAHSRDLHTALAEQRRLTREVHHRVKNNLQIVASLLSLQVRAADSPDVVQTYAVIQARIQALTQVHRWMYDEATSHGVDLQALVGELCAGLETSLVSPAHPQVTMACRLDAIVIHPDVAVPIAFLVTELATLAAQTATAGPLQVQVTATKGSCRATLAIASPGFLQTDQLAAASLTPTARIVQGMVRQLRSMLVHDPLAGSYSIVFGASPP
jgi:two-component sensor histidine kinase